MHLVASGDLPRNPGHPLDLDLVRAIRVNKSAAERRAATIPTRRTVKKEWQAAWLLRAITLMDLTTLSGDDTASNVRRLCAKARHPLREDLVTALGAEELGITVGAVCVYHQLVEVAVKALEGSGIPVAERARLAHESRVAKFNFGTELRMAFGKALRKSLQDQPDTFDRIALLSPTIAALRVETSRVIKNIY